MTLRDYEVEQAIPLLEALGFEFRLDDDGAIVITPPKVLTPRHLQALLERHYTPIGTVLRRRAAAAKRIFVGGPLDGRRHSSYRDSWGQFRIKRGPQDWIAYQRADDDKAYFAGTATSYKKACALCVAAWHELVAEGKIKRSREAVAADH